jgi:hypothetical protein
VISARSQTCPESPTAMHHFSRIPLEIHGIAATEIVFFVRFGLKKYFYVLILQDNALVLTSTRQGNKIFIYTAPLVVHSMRSIHPDVKAQIPKANGTTNVFITARSVSQPLASSSPCPSEDNGASNG